MNKQEFLLGLRGALADLPEADVKTSLDYYAEIIDDQMEEGIPEAEAVASLGTVASVAEQILMDTPLPKLVKAKMRKRRRMTGLELTLLIVGFPIWFPILISLLAVVFAVYVSLWAVVVSLYASDLTLAAGVPVGIVGGVVLFITGNPAAALLILGAGLVCGGLSIFLFLGSNAAAKGMWLLGKLTLRGIKACFIPKKGE